MATIKRIIVWIGLSSANPEKTSLTVKSVLVWAATATTMAAGFAHINIPGQDALTHIIDAIVAFVQTALLFVSSATAVWGAARKVWTTIVDTNRVVNEHPSFE